MTIKINQEKYEFSKNLTGFGLLDLAKIQNKREIVALKINGILKDLSTEIQDNDSIEFVKLNTSEGLNVLRHSCAHLLATAVLRLYKDAKITIGPSVENGFYYDIDYPFKEEDLSKIEDEMKKITKESLRFERSELSIKDAKRLFKDNKYKLELIDEIDKKEKVGFVSIYRLGDFVDLCRGPHLPNTSYLKAFKLTKLAGAYWRADLKNSMLSRVYGVAFASKDELDSYIKLLEEAEKRNHLKLGKELDLFSIHEEGPGFPFFHPKGMIIWNELLNFWRVEHKNAGYVEIKTPIILNRNLWTVSGHWENYRQNMYTLKIDNEDYAIKPMNCPGGLIYYKEKIHSYKEFPLRVGEIGQVHRHELSGVLNGLFRVRSFHQDDAHIFMTEEMIKDEILGVLNLAEKFYSIFGLTYHLELSTMPEKHIGEVKQWEIATDGLKSALNSTSLKYKINEGDGAFYGPKIDIHLKDAIGRTWQCGTIQLDMNLPKRFDITYEGQDGKKHQPVMIHRVIYGSIERFMGILIEHFAGKFPLWLSPEQIRIIPVGHAFDKYANEVSDKLKQEFRVSVDISDDTLGKKIRNAEVDKVNYILVVGDKEESVKSVNVRIRGEKKQKLMLLNDFKKAIQKELDAKSLKSELINV